MMHSYSPVSSECTSWICKTPLGRTKYFLLGCSTELEPTLLHCMTGVGTACRTTHRNLAASPCMTRAGCGKTSAVILDDSPTSHQDTKAISEPPVTWYFQIINYNFIPAIPARTLYQNPLWWTYPTLIFQVFYGHPVIYSLPMTSLKISFLRVDSLCPDRTNCVSLDTIIHVADGKPCKWLSHLNITVPINFINYY